VTENQVKKVSKCSRFVKLFGVLMASPFLIGAITLSYQLVTLPRYTGHFAMARLLEAALFAFGLSLGILGAAFALSSTQGSSSRMLSAALTLFGCSHIVMSFVMRQAIEQSAIGNGPALLPFLIPAILWALSVLLAVKAHSVTESDESQDKTVMEEQPQLLSQP